jgi:hypothetical protein
MRKLRIIGAMLFIFILGFSWIVSGKEAVDDICIPMGSFLLEPPESVTSKRPPVDFPHSQHFDVSCKTCHHTWDYQSAIDTCTTSGCHDLTEAPKKTAGGASDNNPEILYFKSAFHELCLSCHKQIRTQNIQEEKRLRATDKETTIRKAGPLTCKGCHQPE